MYLCFQFQGRCSKNNAILHDGVSMISVNGAIYNLSNL